MDIANWQSLTDKDKSQGVKVRLARVYKRPEQTMVEVMTELKDLTAKDLADFTEWFNAAGYPTTNGS